MLEWFFIHKCQATAPAGDETDDYGRPLRAEPITVTGWLEEKTGETLSPTGEEVTTTGTFTTSLENALPEGTTLVTPNGNERLIIAVERLDGDQLGLPSHAVHHLGK